MVNFALFQWTVPSDGMSGVQGYAYIVDQNPITDPDVNESIWIFDKGFPGAWDDEGVKDPCILQGSYKMWYSGYDGSNWQIGYATSEDGVNWTRSTNPVLTIGAATTWDDEGVSGKSFRTRSKTCSDVGVRC